MDRPTPYYKDFDAWNKVKQHLDKNHRKVHIRAGEIRWISFGVNVGSEIDGKGVSFNRPGLIVNISGTHFALVIPMSSKIKEVAGYLPINWKGETVSLCIHQIRVVSQNRIFSRMGRISDTKLDEYKQVIKLFFSL